MHAQAKESFIYIEMSRKRSIVSQNSLCIPQPDTSIDNK